MSDSVNYTRKGFTMSPKELVFRYLPFLPWVLFSLFITIGIAWLKLRYSTPIYNVSGKILVKQENPYGNSSEKFGNIFGLPGDNNNLGNEMEIIKSRSIAARVVIKLDLQRQYAIKGKIRTSEAHAGDLPFKFLIENIKDSTTGLELAVKIVNDNQFTLNEEAEIYNFGQQVKHSSVTFRLLPIRSIKKESDLENYIISWKPVDQVAPNLSSAVSVGQVENTSVLLVSYQTSNTRVGTDIVNGYMNEYQLASLEEKRQIAYNTLDFIDKQLDTLQRELGGVERNLLKFRESYNVYNPEMQAEQNFTQFSETQKSLNEQGVKLQVVDYLVAYMESTKNANKLVPSNLGINEPSLVEQVSAYNELHLQKETALKTTTQENPLILRMNSAMEKLRADIIQNLKNIRNAYQLSFNEIDRIRKSTDASIKSIPSKEKNLLEVTRRQAILQELYSFLLQKKLETAISSASTISDIKILEPAIAGYTPILPNRRALYTIAILIGLALPIGIIFLLEFLNDKVNSRQDIESATDTPILGEVGHAEDANALVVKQNSRSYIAEQFRIIRSNLQYLLPKDQDPVILVTSSFSGEGKSFVSTNLGAVLALTGKKTVILEMDIRKPKILQGLGMRERKGITNYIVSDLTVEEIVYPVANVDDLFVIPCGPVPPNPAEILLEEKVAQLFKDLKKKFDVIIIDSAPVGLVSDAISLGVYANSSVYIVRHNYSLKKQIHLLDELYKTNKLPKMSIVINDIQKKGGLGGYYGYGYGYGYGNSNKIAPFEYFENDVKKAKRFFKKGKL